MTTVARSHVVRSRESSSGKRAAYAAGLTLKTIATKQGLLLQMLEELDLLQGRTSHYSSARIQASTPLPEASQESLARNALLHALPDGFIERLQASTGVEMAELYKTVYEQLDKVAIFASSDGGSLSSENVRAVERLIQSGRVEMFAR